MCDTSSIWKMMAIILQLPDFHCERFLIVIALKANVNGRWERILRAFRLLWIHYCWAAISFRMSGYVVIFDTNDLVYLVMSIKMCVSASANYFLLNQSLFLTCWVLPIAHLNAQRDLHFQYNVGIMLNTVQTWHQMAEV